MSAPPVEYVYALYNFEAENPDEVSFRVGERVLVVEKDEAYGDGWYQGTNERGETGLFPFSYTTTDESAALMMLNGGFQSEEGAAQTAPAAGAASQGTAAFGAQDRGVMHSTMNDIENALSELHTAEPPQGMSRGLEDDVEREFQARAAARAELARNAQKSLQSQEETAWQGPVGVGEPGTISNRQKTLATTGGGVKPLAMLELSDESEDEVEDEDALPVEKTAPPTMPSEAAHVPHLAGPAVPTAERSMPPGDAFTSQPWPAARETRPEPVPAPTLPTVPAVPTVPVPAPTEQPAATGPAVVDASQWSIDDVVEWARSKDMDASVLEKLREHEVNGASLLSLDINMLKEIDIIAYGRRFKLASAIDELRHGATTPAPALSLIHI